MKLKSRLVLFSYSFVFLFCLASCSKTAILFVDPASEAYFSIQGFSNETLRKAASRSGYSLVVVSLKLTEPFSDQIEAAWGRHGGKEVPLIFPPLLEPEAIVSRPHFPDAKILLLNPSPAEPQEGILSIQYSREQAFRTLGSLAAAWSKLNKAYRVQVLFVTGNQKRQAEQEALTTAFAQNGGATERFVVQSWDLPQSAEALKSAAETFRGDRDSFLLLFIGRQNAEFVQLIAGGKGGILASEQLFSAGRNVPGLIASIDIPWDVALENLLVQPSKVPPEQVIQIPNEAVLTFYSTKLF